MLFSIVIFYLLYLSTLCNFRARIKIVLCCCVVVNVFKLPAEKPFCCNECQPSRDLLEPSLRAKLQQNNLVTVNLKIHCSRFMKFHIFDPLRRDIKPSKFTTAVHITLVVPQRKLETIQAESGLETKTSVILAWCSTNVAMKPTRT